jgi:hypothetical protein
MSSRVSDEGGFDARQGLPLRAVKLFCARYGTPARARTPVLPEATALGALIEASKAAICNGRFTSKPVKLITF